MIRISIGLHKDRGGER